jgi:hypothetical protein
LFTHQFFAIAGANYLFLKLVDFWIKIFLSI